MKSQIILTPAGERLVVIAERDYFDLVEAAEDANDRTAVDTFRHRLPLGEEELIPSEVVDRLLDGESRIRVWREYRQMTSKALAEKAGLTQGFLSQIETGKRDGTISTLRRLAEALSLSIEDLVG